MTYRSKALGRALIAKTGWIFLSSLAISLAVGSGAASAKGGTAKATTSPAPTAPIVVVPPPPAVPPPVFSTAATDIHGFTLTGFIQEATVSYARCPELRNQPSQWGGTALVNGIDVTIPCNTILQMPAATSTWADLFDQSINPEPLTIEAGPGGKFKYPSTEISIVGNILKGEHIAGLVLISQQSTNLGQGYITGFDYSNGVIFVGSKPGGPPQVRLQLNDPNGVFSAGQSPDKRFSVDDENPTIKASTGYPMCVPRSDPTLADDPLCPQRNRPKAAAGCRNFRQAGVQSPAGWEISPPVAGQTYCSGFVMEDPKAVKGTTRPDAMQQAPFEVGDSINYSGTLIRDGKGPMGTDTFSVHTIEANVGIFTQPGTLPVYLAIGEFGVGADTTATAINGLPQEAQNRLFLEASVTDVTSVVDIYMVDFDPVTGKESQRWITPESMTGAITPGSPPYGGGITTQFIGPQPGRARIRATKATPGILVSPTRYVRVVARQLCTPDKVNTKDSLGVPCLEHMPAANGLFTGQYLAPTFEYIFPENIVAGDALVPFNLWDLGFLVNGEGPGTGRLTPTPW